MTILNTVVSYRLIAFTSQDLKMNVKYYCFISTLLIGTLGLGGCFDRHIPSAESVLNDLRQEISKQLSPSSSSNDCNQNLILDGVAPKINHATFKKDSRNLCFEEFALNHSGISKGPLWVAEHLTPEKVARKVKRQGDFHPEDRLAEKERAELSDYKGSRYDRGHMAASGNMSTVSAQNESFSLANIIPQNPKNNQNVWRNIEETARTLVQQSKQDVYLVTGVAYLNSKVTAIGKNKVLVPSHLYKAVYQPNTGIIGAYWIANTASAKAQIISLCELEAKTGVNVFPSLSKNLRRQVYELPTTAKQLPAAGKLKHLGQDKASVCSDKLSAQALKQNTASFE